MLPKVTWESVTRAGRLQRLKLAVAGAMLVASATWLHWPHPKVALTEAVVAAALFLFACWGVGRTLGNACKTTFHDGLCVAIGFASYLVVGGMCLSVHLFHRGFAGSALTVGVGAAIWNLWRTSQKTHPVPSAPGIVLAIVAVALSLLFAASDFRLHPADDSIAYAAFPEKILATGSFIEPYSFRRLASLGGQSVALAYLWPYLDPDQAFIVDRGIGLSICILQIWWWPERPDLKGLHRAAVVLAVASFGAVAINTASYFTGIGLALAAMQLVTAARLFVDVPGRHLATASVAALVIGGFISLRNFHWAPGLIYLVLATTYLGEGKQLSVRNRALPWGVLVVSVFGYCVSGYQSNQTFLYPLMQGNANPLVAMSTHHPWTMLAALARVIVHPACVALIALILVLVSTKRVSPIGKTHLFIALSYALFVTLSMSDSDPADVIRYLSIIVIPAFVFAYFHGPAAGPETPALPTATVTLVSLGFLHHTLATAKCSLESRIGWLEAAAVASPRLGRSFVWEQSQVREAQRAIPPGARVFAAVDDPAYLDFQRNEIMLADMPGYAGGLPTGRGGEALRQHLVERGIQYLIFVTPELSKDYLRPAFRADMLGEDSPLWRTMARLTLDFTNNVQELSTMLPHRYNKNGIVTLNLSPALQ